MGYFLPFYPPNSSKNENFKIKRKKRQEISSFYTNVPETIIICYSFPEIWCATDAIVIFHFGLFFCPFTPNRLTNKISKNWKKSLEISSYLYMRTENYDKMMYGSWDMVCDGQTDRRTDGRKKWHTEVGAPPKYLGNKTIEGQLHLNVWHFICRK